MLVFAACGGGGESVAPEWIGTDDARRTATASSETVADGPLRETLLDEASLDYQDPQSSCFDVVVRSASTDDAPLAELGGRCESGEARVTATINSETVSLYDYDDRGEVETVQAEGTPASAFADLHVEPAESGLSRVVERHARLCCVIAAGDSLGLTLGTERFDWQLR